MQIIFVNHNCKLHMWHMEARVDSNKNNRNYLLYRMS